MRILFFVETNPYYRFKTLFNIRNRKWALIQLQFATQTIPKSFSLHLKQEESNNFI